MNKKEEKGIKKIMKKLLAIACITALTGTMVIGCGKAAETKSESKKEEKISVMLVQSQNIDGLQEMFAKLEEEEGIKIDAQVIPDDQYVKMVQMKKASGELPDVVQNNVPHIFNILEPEKDLYDFSDEEWVSQLVQPDVSQFNGKQYAFPLKANQGCQNVIYNKDFFDKNKLEIPKTPEEFTQLCEDIKKLDVTPILMASDTWVPQMWMTAGFARAMGSDEASKEMTENIFNKKKTFADYPQLANVIDELLALRDKGYLNDDIASLTWDDAWVELSDQSGAMLFGEGLTIGQNQSMFPDTHFGVFNLPVDYDAQDLLCLSKYTSGFVVRKDCEHIDAVKKMFDCFAEPEYLNLYFASAPGFPAFKDVDGGAVQEDVYELYNSHLEDDKLVSEMNVVWGEVESLFSDHLWPYYLEALTKDDIDGQQVMDRFEKDIDKFMEQNQKEE